MRYGLAKEDPGVPLLSLHYLAPAPSLLVRARCLEPSMFDKGAYRNFAYGAGFAAGPIIRSTDA
jgi:hypothetical protein